MFIVSDLEPSSGVLYNTQIQNGIWTLKFHHDGKTIPCRHGNLLKIGGVSLAKNHPEDDAGDSNLDTIRRISHVSRGFYYKCTEVQDTHQQYTLSAINIDERSTQVTGFTESPLSTEDAGEEQTDYPKSISLEDLGSFSDSYTTTEAARPTHGAARGMAGEANPIPELHRDQGDLQSKSSNFDLGGDQEISQNV